VLGEHPRRGFTWVLIPALAGVWLIALPEPLHPHAHGLVPIAETLAAAVLWGLGTVFGRYLGRKLAFEHVSTVRFGFGLIASAIALPLVGAAAFSNLHDSFWIAVLALVTGVFVFDDHLRWTQWLGVAITVGVISLLPVGRRRLVRVPPRAEPGLATT
jgi:drug/metabolite transporter, DME family